MSSELLKQRERREIDGWTDTRESSFQVQGRSQALSKSSIGGC